MLDPLSFFAISSLIVKSAPLWLPPIRDAFLGKAQEKGMDLLFDSAIDKGKKGMRSLLRSDEKEQARHLELVLKNALERGQAAFLTHEEQRQYRSIITTLCHPGPHSETLRREVMRLFSLNENPNFTELNEVYHHLLPQTTSLSTQTPIDAAPYLGNFFDALLAELYADPFFRQQLSDVIQVRAAMSMQRSLTDIVASLRQIGETLADHYKPEQFEQDVQAYTAHIERTLRHLKLVGVVPKERTNENRDPELDGIFVPLRIAMQDYILVRVGALDSLVDLLEQNPCMVLLGGPGSGKSTSTRHLAWSHAIANLSNSTSLANAPLLSGKPLPLRIELRRLNEDRRQRPDYDFLTYASEVLLGRAGLNVPPHMLELLHERRGMLVLFDGLDEVATLDDRRTLVEEIDSFAQRYPGNRFLVTSRPVGYNLAPLSTQTFCEAQIQPFDDGQIHLFLEHWYTHVLRLLPLSSDDQEELETLYSALKGNQRLHSLAENPMLLTVITALHRYERLPDRRILVYDRCADLLLESWAKLKGTTARWINLKLSKEDQYACVAHLGFILHKRPQERQKDHTNEDEEETTSTDDLASDVPLKFMLREIEVFLQSQNLFPSTAEQHAQAKRFLELIQEEAGLIVERGSDEDGEPLYAFVHRTFQEYFAAADVYERYQQEEEPAIISEFLREHMHDPHWREVILLLLGKLKRKPATAQLRLILDGKIQSHRSQYTDVLKQDLFFICDCLTEEIAVENEFVEDVILHLRNLVKNSPFPSQHKEALDYFGKLIHTRLYANLGQRELLTIAIQDKDISTRIRAAQVLYRESPVRTKEQLQAAQILLELGQRLDITFEEATLATKVLYQISLDGSEEGLQALQVLFGVAKRPDLSVEQAEQLIITLYRWNTPMSERAIRLLLDLAQRPDLSIEQSIKVAENLYQCSMKKYPDSRHFASQLLQSLAQRSDLPIELFIQAVWNLYLFNPMSSEVEQFTSQLFLALAQRSDLSVEQYIQVASYLYHSSSEWSNERQFASQLFLALAQRSDLSVELFIKEVENLYDPYSSRYLITRMFPVLIQRPDLTIEQSIQIAKGLYRTKLGEEEPLATQMLLALAQRPDFSIEQSIQVFESLYRCSPTDSEERQLATQTLLALAQRSDLSIEQSIHIAQSLCQTNPVWSEGRNLGTELFLALAQRSDLPVKPFIQAVQSSYILPNGRTDTELQQFVIQLLLQVTQNRSLSTSQRLEAIAEIIAIAVTQYPVRLSMVQIALDLLQEETTKLFFDEYWVPIEPSIESEISDIPLLVKFAREEILPAKVRDEMYQALRKMVPRFGEIEIEGLALSTTNPSNYRSS